MGPSLSQLSNPCPNPSAVLQKYVQGSWTIIKTNDDWKNPYSNELEVSASGIPPSNDLETAFVNTLSEASYAYLSTPSGSSSTGVGLAEFYDFDWTPGSAEMVNISTRSYVGTGEEVVIAGFIIASGNKEVLVTGIGPSLPSSLSRLSNPQLTLYSGTTPLGTINNWADAANADYISEEVINIYGHDLDSNEAAMIKVLPAGSYTVHLSGVSSSTGIGLIEVYDLNY